MQMQVLCVQGDNFTGRIVPRSRAIQRERHGTVSQYRKFVIQQRKCRTLVDSGRQDADAPQRAFRRQCDVVGACAACPDAQTSAVPYSSVVSRTSRDSTIKIFVAEEPGPPAAFG